jgi:hypothetical protein
MEIDMGAVSKMIFAQRIRRTILGQTFIDLRTDKQSQERAMAFSKL